MVARKSDRMDREGDMEGWSNRAIEQSSMIYAYINHGVHCDSPLITFLKHHWHSCVGNNEKVKV
jgi:hypothetical protein